MHCIWVSTGVGAQQRPRAFLLIYWLPFKVVWNVNTTSTFQAKYFFFWNYINTYYEIKKKNYALSVVTWPNIWQIKMCDKTPSNPVWASWLDFKNRTFLLFVWNFTFLQNGGVACEHWHWDCMYWDTKVHLLKNALERLYYEVTTNILAHFVRRHSYCLPIQDRKPPLELPDNPLDFTSCYSVSSVISDVCLYSVFLMLFYGW